MSGNDKDALAVLARYLAGERVPGADLERAWAALKRDPARAAHVERTLGVHGWDNVCDTFLSNLAEFASLTQAEREREMPELLRHAESCASCRRAYWRIKPLWVVEASQAVAQGVHLVLAEAIRVATDAAGRLVEVGLGPPALAVRRVAATAGAPTQERLAGAEPLEWPLADEDMGVKLKPTLIPREDGGAEMTLRLEADAAREAGSLRVDVRTVEGRRILAGRLAAIESEPLVLESGSYVVHVEASELRRSWTLRIELLRRAPERGTER
jgi:hypothetical protein